MQWAAQTFAITMLFASACVAGVETPSVLQVDSLARPTRPELASAAGFAVLADQAYESAGVVSIRGRIGTGAQSQQALLDADATFRTVSSATCNVLLQTTELGGRVLKQGVTCVQGDAQLHDSLVLDAQGNDHALFILRVTGALDVAPRAVVRLADCARADGVHWAIGQDAALGVAAKLVGNILSGGDVVLQPEAELRGRAIATRGSVVVNAGTVSIAAL